MLMPIRTDLSFGSSQLKYLTANLLTQLEVDGANMLLVYGWEGLTYEVAFEVGNPTAKNVTGPTDVQNYATVSGFSPFHDARELKLCPAFRIAHS